MGREMVDPLLVLISPTNQALEAFGILLSRVWPETPGSTKSATRYEKGTRSCLFHDLLLVLFLPPVDATTRCNVGLTCLTLTAARIKLMVKSLDTFNNVLWIDVGPAPCHSLGDIVRTMTESRQSSLCSDMLEKEIFKLDEPGSRGTLLKKTYKYILKLKINLNSFPRVQIYLYRTSTNSHK